MLEKPLTQPSKFPDNTKILFSFTAKYQKYSLISPRSKAESLLSNTLILLQI